MINASTTSLSVEVAVDRQVGRLFETLSVPSNHVHIDGSDTLRVSGGADRITAVGQTFTMAMEFPSRGCYEVINHVVAFDINRHIAWMPAKAGAEPVGVRWDWLFTPIDGIATIVTQRCDWSRVTDVAYLARTTFPRVTAQNMRETIARLAARV